MSANCEYYETLISRMLDDDLPPQETELLREHIRTCKSCRTLCAAFSGISLSLRDDLMEPPANFRELVMHKVKVDATSLFLASVFEQTLNAPPAQPDRPKKRWKPTLIAACLVLVIGVVVVSSPGRRKSADTAETAAYSSVTEAQQNAAPAAAESAAFDTAVAEEGEPEEAAPMEPAAPEAAAAGTVQGYTVTNPAFVPEGSEAAFEALLTDAGHFPEGNLHVFYYVEHRGVIYEFMTDESEECLLWRDAAEGSPTLSQSSFDDLWAIFK